MTKSTSSGHIAELESLRGIAALFVLFYHVPGWYPPFYDIAAFRSGYLMVDFFFVLSGFVICRSYASQLTSLREVLRFQWLRFWRVYPVHLLFLFVFLGFECLRYIAVHRLGMSMSPAPFSENDGPAFIRQLFLVHAIGPAGDGGTFNYPSWSISVEFYTYAVFALLMLVLRGLWRWVGLALVVAGSATLLLTGAPAGYQQMLGCLAAFSLGCLLTRLTGKSGLLRVAAGATFIAGATLLWQQQAYNLAAASLSAAVVLAAQAFAGRALLAPLRARALVWLGLVSYSLYMCHASVIWVVNQALKVGLNRPQVEHEGTHYVSLSATEALAAIAVIVAGSLLLAALSHWLVESPLRRFSRRVVSR